MGSNGSKPNVDSATVHKNDVDVSYSSDPRSPTPEILRTPLQEKPGSKHNITKNIDLRKTFDATKSEEKLIHNNPILSAVIKNHLQSYDPRSPTQDFERTPIVIACKTDELINSKRVPDRGNDNSASPTLKTEADENCDSCTEAQELSPDLIVPRNLCNGFYNISLNDTIKDHEEPLGSSTASNEALEDVSSSHDNDKPKKLLETNFDYVESEDKLEDSQEITEGTLLQNSEEILNIPFFEILNSDPRSPSIGIERTPIVVCKINEDNSEDNVEEMSDDSLIKVLQNTNAELRQTGIKTQESGEGLLVYEDDITSINDTPKKSKSCVNGSRTPLSCMKNKDADHTTSKSATTLYEPMTQKMAASKIPKKVSHIPRLKSLTKTSKLVTAGSSVSLKTTKYSSIGGDCENTPPHSHRDIWDKESSIVL